jgi:Zn-finger nucleic acid-binding protein
MSWVPGDIVASLVSRPTEFRSIVDAARAAPTSPRSLRCPKCRTSSLHELKVRGVPIDVCDRCGGMALDPNEGKVLDRLSSRSYSAGERTVDAAQGADALLQIVIAVVKLTKALL